MTIHGAVLSGQQRYAEAEILLLKGYEGMSRNIMLLNQQTRQLAQGGEWVVQFYEVTNRPEKAREWRERIAASVAKLRNP